jgi:hypothetical protein
MLSLVIRLNSGALQNGCRKPNLAKFYTKYKTWLQIIGVSHDVSLLNGKIITKNLSAEEQKKVENYLETTL